MSSLAVFQLADSAWLLIKSNMEVLFVGLSQMMSTIVASGTAVIDFFLDSVNFKNYNFFQMYKKQFLKVVFFTFLVFLLSSSDDDYKPMKIIRDIVPSRKDLAVKLTQEMEAAVRYSPAANNY